MNTKKLLAAILSLSMATALVGTGISPALNAIKEYYYDAPPILIQMVVSLPSLLMVIVAIPFSAISNRFSMKSICVAGLILYTAGGIWGGLTNDIYTLMFTRVIIGLGSGLLMPMSVGLLSYFFDKQEQDKLNGYIVVLTSIISIISMVLVGWMADISWRLVFLVYMFGIPCIWLSGKYIPSTVLKSHKNRISMNMMKKIWAYALGIFIMMILYFAMLNNFAVIATAEGIITPAWVGVVMSIQTLSSLFTGIYLEQIKKVFGKYTKYMIWFFALIGMLSLCVKGGVLVMSIGLACFGVGLAMGVGMFNAQACMVCEKEEALSSMSVISFARCLGQFGSPVVLSTLQMMCASDDIRFSYYCGTIMAIFMLFIFIPVPFVVVEGLETVSNEN